MPEIQKVYVTDTMAIVLWLERRRLPVKVHTIFEDANDLSNGIVIWIPGMVLAEVGYLFEKNRIETSLDDIQILLTGSTEKSGFKVAELTLPVIRRTFQIDDVPELHDRLIAGTALTLNCELLTNDPKIENSTWVETIWG